MYDLFKYKEFLALIFPVRITWHLSFYHDWDARNFINYWLLMTFEVKVLESVLTNPFTDYGCWFYMMGNNLPNRKTEPIFTLAVASRLSNIPTHSIRQYIDKGLIIPFKTDTNRHLFSEIDIIRLKNIHSWLNQDGLNVAGIKFLHALVPCWSIRECDDETRENCEAYYGKNQPCWEASQKGALCRSSDCKSCEVYNRPEIVENLKEFLKKKGSL